MKKLILLTYAGFLPCLLFGQSVSLTFTDNLNQADGFENSSGVASDGLSWGIVVDTEGSGFGDITTTGTISFFDPDSSGTSVGGLTYLYGNSGSAPVTTTALGAVGSITTLTAVDFTGLVSNDPFAVFWFAEPATFGSAYGVLQDANFLIPSSGNTQSFADLAVFSGTGNFSADYNFAPVPEPSHFALAFGLIGLGVVVWRRRRERG